ncbi:MAG: hypothetical protein KF693_16300 [Nitrospira sp.]|nr:hypothetical protein [Nitrospira sp.]
MTSTRRSPELVELTHLGFEVLRHKMLDAHRKALHYGKYHHDSVDELPLAHTGDDPADQFDQQRVARLLMATDRRLLAKQEGRSPTRENGPRYDVRDQSGTTD